MRSKLETSNKWRTDASEILLGQYLTGLVIYIQRFRVKYGLLGSEAGKVRPLVLGRMFANDAKTV